MTDRAESRKRPILNLEGAFIRRTNLSDADLSGANLSRVDASGALFRNSDFRGARLIGTILRGADLTGARNLTLAQLAEAVIDDQTQLPAYIDRRTLSGAVKADSGATS